MTQEQIAQTVQEELSHMPEGEGPQAELRRVYQELRYKGPAEDRSAVFHDALMTVFKRHPQFRFQYDGRYFRHT